MLPGEGGCLFAHSLFQLYQRSKLQPFQVLTNSFPGTVLVVYKGETAKFIPHISHPINNSSIQTFKVERRVPLHLGLALNDVHEEQQASHFTHLVPTNV